MIVVAREKYLADRASLEKALEGVRAASAMVSEEVVAAVRSLGGFHAVNTAQDDWRTTCGFSRLTL